MPCISEDSEDESAPSPILSAIAARLELPDDDALEKLLCFLHLFGGAGYFMFAAFEGDAARVQLTITAQACSPEFGRA